MKLRHAILALVLPTLALVGCSDTQTVLGADTAAPLAPVIQGAGARDGMLIVWWSPNGESDLAGYNVYTTETGTPSMANGLPLQDNRYTRPIDGGSLQVYVTAVDVNGNESSPSATLSVHADMLDDIAEKMPSSGIDDGKN